MDFDIHVLYQVSPHVVVAIHLEIRERDLRSFLGQVDGTFSRQIEAVSKATLNKCVRDKKVYACHSSCK